MQPKVLAYTEEDKRRILVGVSGLLQSTAEAGSMDWKKLTDLKKDLTRISLHASTLNEYVAKNQIPRGLRIQKGPVLFMDHGDFKTKWEAILNKCSQDLMLLLIEESITTSTMLEADIIELEDKIKQNCNNEQVFSTKWVKLQKV